MTRLFSLIAATTLVLLLARTLHASRMAVPVDTAIDRADLIAVGRTRPLSDQPHVDNRPQLIQLTVDKCWKGGAKPGDQVICVDWNPFSTARFYFSPTGPSLVFLKIIDPKSPNAAKLPRDIREPFDMIDVKTVHDLSRLTALARTPKQQAMYAQSIRHETHVLDATQRLLDVLFIDKPADPNGIWRKMLADDANPVLLLYAAERLPQPLSAADGELLVKTVLRIPKERDVATRIYSILIKGKYHLDPARLHLAVESGGPLSWPLSSMVDAAGIQAIQATLFRRLTAPDDPDYADTASLLALARFAPDFTKEKLRATQLPFDIELPLLHGLGVNGSAVGRPDYPGPMLKANASIVHQIGRIVRDPDAPFNLEFSMEHLLGAGGFRQDWQALAPLMAPLLSSPDDLRRRQTVAFLRTLGYTVKYDAGTHKLAIPAEATALPVRASITAPTTPLTLGQSWTADYLLTASVERIFLSAKPGKFTWRIVPIGMESRAESSVGMDSSNWTEISTEPKAFIELKNGQSTPGRYQLPANLFKSPGRYRITLHLLYRDPGDAAGLDAWTGALQSTPLEIQITP